MRIITADLIVPVSSPPVKNGVVVVDDQGTVLQVGEQSIADASTIEKYEGIVCPGFINAHCHLELSYMKGRIAKHTGMAQFIIDLIEYRNQFGPDAEGIFQDEALDAMQHAHEEMVNEGIVGIGDISNDVHSFSVKSLSPLQFHTFIECFGLDAVKTTNYFSKSYHVYLQAVAAQLSASITPHAPYSVSPDLFQRIFSFDENKSTLYSYHNQESSAEEAMFISGNGEFMKFFSHFGIPIKDFHPTGKNSLQSVINHFPSEKRTLFVHNVTSDAHDIELIINRIPGAGFCICPNANLYIGNGLPSINLFRKYDDRICIGTDSYASNDRLSVLSELITLQQYFPELSTVDLIRWATINGARFFNWTSQLGSLEAGKNPGLVLISPVNAALQLQKDTKARKLV